MDNTKLNSYVDFILDELKTIMAIDSPTGYTENAAKAVAEEFNKLGYNATRTVKGGVLVDLGGKPENGILIETHLDTLGAMVVEI